MPLAGLDPWRCEVACSANKACAGYVFVFTGCEGTPAPGHCYLKKTLKPTQSESCTCTAVKPFSGGGGGGGNTSQSVVSFVASYAPLSTLDAGASHTADVAVFGLTTIGSYKLGPPPNDVVYVTERQAFVDCVGEFLLDGPSRENRTVKVNGNQKL
jgi:hypothetical protein